MGNGIAASEFNNKSVQVALERTVVADLAKNWAEILVRNEVLLFHNL